MKFEETQKWLCEQLGLSSDQLNRLLLTLLLVVISFLARRVLHSIAKRRVGDPGKRILVTKTGERVINLLALFIVIHIWFGGFSDLVQNLGILSAGLAIALQEPLTHIAGWIFINVRQPFVVGDRIQIGQLKGDVIDIRLFQFTLLEVGEWVHGEQPTGRVIHVPNGTVFKQPQSNYSQGNGLLRDELQLCLSFESDWRHARELLLDIARRHASLEAPEGDGRHSDQIAEHDQEGLAPSAWIHVTERGIMITLRYACPLRQRRIVCQRIWEDVLRAAERESAFEFAYPTTRIVHRRRDERSNPVSDSPLPGPDEEKWER
ncbi:MAG: hypothetical protein RL095_2120 [Verrucomicrobiota bacterium]|jgi:small-conductance mechanosensitive channel